MNKICSEEELPKKLDIIKRIKEERDFAICDDMFEAFKTNDRDAITKLQEKRPQDWDEFSNFILSDEFDELKRRVREESEGTNES